MPHQESLNVLPTLTVANLYDTTRCIQPCMGAHLQIWHQKQKFLWILAAITGIKCTIYQQTHSQICRREMMKKQNV